MFAVGQNRIVLTAIFAAAVLSPASAEGVDDALGRWTNALGVACKADDKSESAPLTLSKDDKGYHLGDYGFGCTFKTWEPDAPFFKSVGECAISKGTDVWQEAFRVGLTSGDQLVVVQEATITVYNRCPAGN